MTNITSDSILTYTVTIIIPDPENAAGEIEMQSVQETSYKALQAELRADFDLPNHQPLDVRPGKFGRPSTASASMSGPAATVSIHATL